MAKHPRVMAGARVKALHQAELRVHHDVVNLKVHRGWDHEDSRVWHVSTATTMRLKRPALVVAHKLTWVLEYRAYRDGKDKNSIQWLI